MAVVYGATGNVSIGGLFLAGVVPGIVTAFLQTYFPRYVEYSFTAHLEEELDDISGGKIDWRQVLREFWKAFSSAVGETKELRVREVLDKIDADLGPHFFPEGKDGKRETLEVKAVARPLNAAASKEPGQGADHQLRIGSGAAEVDGQLAVGQVQPGARHFADAFNPGEMRGKFPRAHIISFEPLPEPFAELQAWAQADGNRLLRPSPLIAGVAPAASWSCSPPRAWPATPSTSPG